MFKGIFSSFLLVLMLFNQFYNSVVWIRYELNMDEITELFCINKDKPELMCNGKCHVSKELIEVDLFPQSSETPLTEALYLPSLKLYMAVAEVKLNAKFNIVLNLTYTSKSSLFWKSTHPDPPFIPPRLVV